MATANFYLTDAGKAAALDATNNSINIEVTQIAIGTAKYDAQVTAPTQTALTTEVGRYNLAGGGSNGQVLRLTTTITPNYTAEIFEIGLFLSDGTLFAVAAVTGTDPLMQTANGLTSVITLACSLADIGSNVTVSVDANSPIAVVLMNQHIENSDPHTQYLLKTDFNTGVIALQHADSVLQQNINTEEANRISADNLLNDKIDYEITQRSNADADLENRKFNKLGGTISGDVNVTGTTRLKRLELFSQSGGQRVTLNPENGNYEFYNNVGDKGFNIRIDSSVVHFDTYGTDTIETSSKFQVGGFTGGGWNGYAIELGDVVFGAALIKTNGDQFSFNKPISAPNLFGTQQTWQDVTASRQLNQTYFNGTGAPIEVKISVKGGSIRNKVYVNSLLISDQMSTYNTGEPIIVSSFTVPPGDTYSIDASGGTLHIWAELR